MNSLGSRLRIFMIILLIIVVVGTAGFMITEGLSFADAFYFSIVTVTTVGYGDISPMSNSGKILSIFLILTGVGTFLGVVANATEMLLQKQEKNMRMEKLNMVISAFYSELGTRLLTLFVESDPNIDTISKEFIISGDWSAKEFSDGSNRAKNHDFSIDIQKINLESLRNLLNEKGNLLLRLLENPSILEHESFTELLRASSHLREELLYRGDFRQLPGSDLAHLSGDVKRAYGLLASQWFHYMKHLKNNYPYLFSLAMRMNPFDRSRSPVVQA
ncbi:two pore domain potassium channel family protein [bacterium]|nr:MAG: two pore domain potassium channel family protein [bacterium]